MTLPRATLVGLLAISSLAWGAGEYTGKDLYTVPRPADPGGIVLHLNAGQLPIARVVAVGRQARNPYLGVLSDGGATATFQHLPADRYDLLVVTPDAFYEGLQLVSQPDAAAAAAEREAVVKEVGAIEAFFDGKAIPRLEFADDQAVCLLQQWRIGVALTEAATVIKGTIHSIDLVWFERPNRGWQLLRRRQLYRDELAAKQPFRHQHLPALGNIRVVSATKDVTVTLPEIPPQDIKPLPPPSPAAKPAPPPSPAE
jgi:hypothetical protein